MKTLSLVSTLCLALFFLACEKENEMTYHETTVTNSLSSSDANPTKSFRNNQKVLGDTCYADTTTYNNELPTCVDTIFMTNNTPFVDISPFPNSVLYEVTYIPVAPIDPSTQVRIICRSGDKGTVVRCATLYTRFNVFGCIPIVEKKKYNDGTNRYYWIATTEC